MTKQPTGEELIKAVDLIVDVSDSFRTLLTLCMINAIVLDHVARSDGSTAARILNTVVVPRTEKDLMELAAFRRGEV